MFDFIGPAISAVAGLFGTSQTNDANAAIAAQNNAFNAQQVQQQENFQATQTSNVENWEAAEANTTYQRGTKDMIAAGLNPMLAYTQGGDPAPSVSAPSGAAAVGSVPQYSSPIGAAANSAGAAAKMLADLSNVGADTDAKRALAAKYDAERHTEENRPRNVKADTEVKLQQADLLGYDMAAALRRNQTSRIEDEAANVRSEGALLDAQRHLTERSADLSGTQAVLNRFEFNRARAASDFAGSWWGRNVSPALGDLGKSISGAGQLYRFGH